MLRAVPWHASHRLAGRPELQECRQPCAAGRRARHVRRQNRVHHGRAACPRQDPHCPSACEVRPPATPPRRSSRVPRRRGVPHAKVDIGTAWYLSHADAVAVPVCDAARAAFLRSDQGPRGASRAERTHRYLSFVHAVPIQIFNVGDFRRRLLGQFQEAEFFRSAARARTRTQRHDRARPCRGHPTTATLVYGSISHQRCVTNHAET
jgi:hypothetical protein